MVEYSDQEKNEIIREFFGAAQQEGIPRCFRCGEILEIRCVYREEGSPEVHVRCRHCRADFSWSQTRAESPWKRMHLQYFLERYRSEQAMRCPVDDCKISYIEYEGGIIEFRCPYCNRRGKAAVSDD